MGGSFTPRQSSVHAEYAPAIKVAERSRTYEFEMAMARLRPSHSEPPRRFKSAGALPGGINYDALLGSVTALDALDELPGLSELLPSDSMWPAETAETCPLGSGRSVNSASEAVTISSHVQEVRLYVPPETTAARSGELPLEECSLEECSPRSARIMALPKQTEGDGRLEHASSVQSRCQTLLDVMQKARLAERTRAPLAGFLEEAGAAEPAISEPGVEKTVQTCDSSGSRALTATQFSVRPAQTVTRLPFRFVAVDASKHGGADESSLDSALSTALPSPSPPPENEGRTEESDCKDTTGLTTTTTHASTRSKSQHVLKRSAAVSQSHTSVREPPTRAKAKRAPAPPTPRCSLGAPRAVKHTPRGAVAANKSVLLGRLNAAAGQGKLPNAAVREQPEKMPESKASAQRRPSSVQQPSVQQ